MRADNKTDYQYYSITKFLQESKIV